MTRGMSSAWYKVDGITGGDQRKRVGACGNVQHSFTRKFEREDQFVVGRLILRITKLPLSNEETDGFSDASFGIHRFLSCENKKEDRKQ